jgi:SAM-dependent methyltransferase
MTDAFGVLILTHGRPHTVKTYQTLRAQGYTGDVWLVVDNEDQTLDEYDAEYPGRVVVFDKAAVAATIDECDNFDDRRAVIYARCASFDIARDLGLRYFLQLDDDYTSFRFRFDDEYRPIVPANVRDLDALFATMLGYYKTIPALSIAMLQGGDMLGGRAGQYSKAVRTYRKCMNTFFCDVERPYSFIGRVNEDVNTYVRHQSLGHLFLSVNNVSVEQVSTQAGAGGMTGLYQDSGTYIKSFYTVMLAPSCVKVHPMHSEHPRLHHKIRWHDAVPKIVSEQLRKTADETQVSTPARAADASTPSSALLDVAPAEALPAFVRRCAALDLGDLKEIETTARRTLRYASATASVRAQLRPDQHLEDQWYRSLAAGAPDWSVYDTDAYLGDLWACWIQYSRSYLRSCLAPKSLPPTGVFGSLGQVARVADLGCGIGYTSAAFAQLFPHAQVVGTNFPGMKQTRLAEHLGQQYGFRVVAEVEQIEGPVDLVFASEYFEHIPAPIEHLLDVLRALQPRALLVASAFGTRSVGHFDTYTVAGRQVPAKNASQLFDRCLTSHGYSKVKTQLWNNRPAYWRRHDKAAPRNEVLL